MIAKRIPLGVVVCQRRFHLFDEGGNPHAVTVTLGTPVPTDSEGGLLEAGAEATGTFRCPFQIEGLGHDAKIEAVFGQDPYVALQYAIDFIGIRLDGWSTEQRFLTGTVHQNGPHGFGHTLQTKSRSGLAASRELMRHNV